MFILYSIKRKSQDSIQKFLGLIQFGVLYCGSTHIGDIMKEKILYLRSIGKTYNQIVKELGCSKATVCYYCNSTQQSKRQQRQRKYREQGHPFNRKLNNFIDRKSRKPIVKNPICNSQQLIKDKITKFCNEREKMPRIKIEEVISIFEKNPTCYLTGYPIDINKPRTYQFDHKVPSSRGGTNTLDNLGICTKQANLAKSDMTHDEFVEFCKTVLINHGFTVTK